MRPKSKVVALMITQFNPYGIHPWGTLKEEHKIFGRKY
jgi:hypothetical protein